MSESEALRNRLASGAKMRGRSLNRGESDFLRTRRGRTERDISVVARRRSRCDVNRRRRGRGVPAEVACADSIW